MSHHQSIHLTDCPSICPSFLPSFRRSPQLAITNFGVFKRTTFFLRPCFFQLYQVIQLTRPQNKNDKWIMMIRKIIRMRKYDTKIEKDRNNNIDYEGECVPVSNYRSCQRNLIFEGGFVLFAYID